MGACLVNSVKSRLLALLCAAAWQAGKAIGGFGASDARTVGREAPGSRVQAGLNTGLTGSRAIGADAGSLFDGAVSSVGVQVLLWVLVSACLIGSQVRCCDLLFACQCELPKYRAIQAPWGAWHRGLLDNLACILCKNKACFALVAHENNLWRNVWTAPHF
eukprot:1159156-Pelagomonas_calceolata.AAC.8